MLGLPSPFQLEHFGARDIGNREETSLHLLGSLPDRKNGSDWPMEGETSMGLVFQEFLTQLLRQSKQANTNVLGSAVIIIARKVSLSLGLRH